MIGLDTNVLVRYVAQDDAVQSALATRLMESLARDRKGFVSAIALCETVWVLRRAYKQPKEKVLAVVKAVLEADVLEVEHRACAWRAYYDFDDGDADFSDYYLAEIAHSRDADFTATFDAAALKHRLFKHPSEIA